MINNLTLIQQGNDHYIDSREVAQVIGKAHKNLLNDIRKYIEVIRKSTGLKIKPSDFFVENSYLDSTGRKWPCYLLSKMGCEMIATKLTGERGVLFSVAYVSTYNEMEAKLCKDQEMKLQLIPNTYTAQQLAYLIGMYSLYGNPHSAAIYCLLNENIFVSNKHKYAVSINYEDGIIYGFRYGECSIKLVHDWLNDYDYPNEIHGFCRTYHVIYRTNQ